jgi:hypothetical protein
MNKLIRILPLAALLAVGCGKGLQAQADPDQARQALCTVLDAWQRGDAPDSLRTASPAVHAKDLDWSAGYRLARYQVASEGGRAGTDLRYAAMLTLQDGRGRTFLRNAAYTVGTSPVLTVVRQDPES